MRQSFPGRQGEPAPSRASHAAVARDHETGSRRTLFLAGRPGKPHKRPTAPSRRARADGFRLRTEGPVRRDLGPWRVLPVTGGLTNDRGPQADAEERIRSAHRAIEIREKRRGVLSSFCLDYLALQPTSSVNDVPVTRARYRLVDAQNAPFGAASMVMGTAHHNVPNGGSGASGRRGSPVIFRGAARLLSGRILVMRDR